MQQAASCRWGTSRCAIEPLHAACATAPHVTNRLPCSSRSASHTTITKCPPILVLQLRYGEDGMDPVAMEGKGGEPVMFSRVLSVRALRMLCMPWLMLRMPGLPARLGCGQGM